MKYQWKKYPEYTPTDSGYYYTVHLLNNDSFYKGIWWNNESNKWVHWRINEWRDNVSPNVIAFILESRNDYYVPCVMSMNEQNCSRYYDVR